MVERQQVEVGVTDVITCPKCHKFISEPRLLRCLHTCCRYCAESELLSGAEHVAVRCPQCRSLTPQPVAELPAAPYITRIRDWYARSDERSGRCEECTQERGRVVSYCKDCNHFICQECVQLHSRMKALVSHVIIPARDYKRVLEYQVQSLNAVVPNCPTHGQPATTYCDGCSSLHCTRCCEEGGAEQHATKCATVSCSERTTQLREDLASVSAYLSAFRERMSAINSLEDNVHKQQTLMHTILETSFAELTKKLEELKKALLYAIDLDMKGIVAQLDSEKGHVESKAKETEQVSEACERCLSYSSSYEILSLGRQLHLGMQECCVSIELVTKEAATPTPLLRLQQSCGDAILEVCRNHISQNHLPDLSLVVIKGEGMRYMEVNTLVQFTVQLVCASGHPCIEKQFVTAEVTYPRTEENIPVEVEPSCEMGTYTVQYTPKVKGQYRVSVKLNDKEVPSSPFYPVAILSSRDYSSPLFVLNVEWVWGVACSAQRLIYVTQNSHGTVLVLNKEGKPLKTLCQKGQKAGYLWYPTGITVNEQNHLFICDGKENGRVQKLSDRGHHLGTFGGLNNPCGIYLSRKGLLYVCDKKNSHVMVLDQDLQLLKVLGDKKGHVIEEDYCHVLSGPDMKTPHAVAEDDGGNIYVTDTEKHCIHVYDEASSNIVRVITKPPSMREEFSPAGICIQGKFVYVSDVVLNTLITLLTTGELVAVSGGFGYNLGQFYTPQSMQLDIDGYLHVCDYGNSRVLIF